MTPRRRTEVRFPHDDIFWRRCHVCATVQPDEYYTNGHGICRACRASREKLRRAGVAPTKVPKHRSRLSAQMAADVEIQERAGAGPVRVRSSG